jgi:hypothetical protein
MVSNPVWEICERVAEVQALLDDHLAGGKHSAADVIAKAQSVMTEPVLLRALFDVGYLPPSHGPPPVTVARSRLNQAPLPTSDRMMRPTASLGLLKAISMSSKTTRALSVTLASSQTLN